MRDVAFGGDGTVGMDAVRSRYESELANEYGNLASRTMAMVRRYRDGVVPDVGVDPALAGEFDGLAERVAALLDRAEITRRWRRSGSASGAVTATSRSARRGSWPRTPRPPAQLERRSPRWPKRVRVLSVLLHPYMPEATEQLLAALSAPSSSTPARPSRRRGGGRTVQALEPLFPKRAVIDSHTHLDAVRAARRRSRRRRGRGRRDPDRHRGDRRRSPAGRRWPRPSDFDEVYAAIGRHPNSATGFDDAALDDLRALAATRSAWPSARRALTTTATTRRPRISAAPSRPRSSSPASSASRW